MIDHIESPGWTTYLVVVLVPPVGEVLLDPPEPVDGPELGPVVGIAPDGVAVELGAELLLGVLLVGGAVLAGADVVGAGLLLGGLLVGGAVLAGAVVGVVGGPAEGALPPAALLDEWL